MFRAVRLAAALLLACLGLVLTVSAPASADCTCRQGQLDKQVAKADLVFIALGLKPFGKILGVRLWHEQTNVVGVMLVHCDAASAMSRAIWFDSLMLTESSTFWVFGKPKRSLRRSNISFSLLK